MKIVAIIASPHGMKGNTGRLLEEVLAGLEPEAELELLELSRLNVKPCTGCDHCHKTGVCPIKDDYEPIKKSLLAADGFILASPNYIFSVSAQLKAFFDRCGNIIHCLMLEDKYGALVETSGGGDDDDVLAYMTRFVNSTGAQSVGGIGSPIAGARVFPQQDALFEKARELGKSLCQCIRDKEHFPDQAGYRGAFKTRMRRLVEYYKDEWSAEYDYWQYHHKQPDKE
ncbi:MAG: flavodoxin family protein [Trichlorobacter sp.]|jgi:multimeric flavodoxin WrbA|nr:flavodoxin family protein [Trichlorobacter sp.]